MIGRFLSGFFKRERNAIRPDTTDPRADSSRDKLRAAIDSGELDKARSIAGTLSEDELLLDDVLIQCGRLELASGNLDDASVHLDRVLGRTLDNGDAHSLRAEVFMQQGLGLRALEHALAAERLNPGNAQLLSLIGVVRLQQNDIPAALAALASALAVDPRNTNALGNLATFYFQQQEWSLAAGYFRDFCDARPESVDALLQYASCLIALGRDQEAWPLFERAVKLPGAPSDAYRNYASALFNEGKVAEARVQIDAGLDRYPDQAILHMARANCELIARGNAAEGWAEYEWRRKLNESRFGVRTKLWDGNAQNSRKLLVYAEQGAGDVLMFARYLPLLRSSAGELVIQIPSALERLMLSSAARFGWGVSRWAVGDVRVEPHEVAYDCEVPLLSLLHVCRFPVARCLDPYLAVDSDLVDDWARRLGPRHPDRLRVGLAWAGNPIRQDDELRSILPEHLAPLGALGNVEFVSLQMNAKAQYDCQMVPFAVKDPTSEIRDFADSAAIMRNLDLVLSIDTAAAHLAGAVGVPCWVLLSRIPDWRWKMGDVDQPWYGLHRSFNVGRNRDWLPLIERVADELKRETCDRR